MRREAAEWEVLRELVGFEIARRTKRIYNIIIIFNKHQLLASYFSNMNKIDDNNSVK